MSNMTEIDQFVRHLQAELEETNGIMDLQLREQRQWQIEIAIQESLKFIKKIEERKILKDSNIFKEVEAVRIIKKKSKLEAKSNSEKSTTDCPKCEEGRISDLGFCESCGYKN